MGSPCEFGIKPPGFISHGVSYIVIKATDVKLNDLVISATDVKLKINTDKTNQCI